MKLETRDEKDLVPSEQCSLWQTKKEVQVKKLEAVFDLFARGRAKLYICWAGVGVKS